MIINQLRDHEVFVFGSNAQGFHGAGAAGLACRGDARNTWRQDEHFCNALRTPENSDARVGKWAVLGVARGFQVGREGKSYGIEILRFTQDDTSGEKTFHLKAGNLPSTYTALELCNQASEP